MATYQIHWVDYLVFILILLITAGIGALFALTGGRQRTTNEYFSGDRRLDVLPTALSIVVTYMSAVMVIGIPAEAYMYGGELVLGALGEALGICLAAAVIVPMLYPLQLVSINKYLEMRYDSQYPKLFATCLGVFQNTVYTAIVLLAPSASVASLTGFPVWSVIFVSAALAIFYTSIGGIKAVIWSDTFLCICMLSGMILMSVQGVRYAGGLSSAFQISLDGGRLNLFNFSINPTTRVTVWSMLIGLGFNGFSAYGTVQPVVQRYSNVRSLNKARITLALASIGNMLMYILPISAGLSIYAYYKHIGCDPIKAGIIDGQNQLVPHFVMDVLNFPGIPGLFISSLAAGSLSTVSSILNSSAAIIWDDILKGRLPEHLTKRGALISKLVVMSMGIMSILCCYIFMIFGGTIFQLSLSVNSITLVPMLGMVLHGIFCPWINTKGVLTGSIAGMLFITWVVLGQYYNTRYTVSQLPTDVSQCNTSTSSGSHNTSSYSGSGLTNTTILESLESATVPAETFDEDTEFNPLNWLYSISYTWYVISGNIIMFIVGSIVSLFTGRQVFHSSQERLIIPCFRRYFVKEDNPTVHDNMLSQEEINEQKQHIHEDVAH